MLTYKPDATPSDGSAKIKSEVTPGREIPAAKPLSVRQLELAELWVMRLRAGENRMPEWMRREFFSLFWEEQCERAAEGRPLRLPPGTDAHEQFLLGEAALELG